MRRRLLFALPVLAAIIIGAGMLLLGHAEDPIVAAKQRIARNDMKGASLYLREAIRAQPTNPEAAFLLGKVDLALGNPAFAQLEFLRARDHGYDPAAIIIPLGQAYLQQHHTAELLRDFSPDASPPGTKADILSLRAAAEMAQRNLDAAEATAASAEAIAPDNAYVLLIAARIALVRDDLDGAARRITRILSPAVRPDSSMRDDTRLLQGELAMRRGDAKSALASARAVIETSPNRLDAHLLEARALAASGQEEAARKVVETVLHRAPKDISANYLRAVIAIHQADFAAADVSLQAINAAIPELPRGFYFLAVTKLGLQQFAQAEEAATQFLAQAPDDILGLKLMALVDLGRNHSDRALTLLQESALATHPDADTLDLRGRALALAGDLKGARDNLSRAAALHPTDPAILNRLAAVEMDLGNIPAGEADLKHSLQLAPKQSRTGAAIVEADLARFDLAAAQQDLDTLRTSLGDVEAVGVLDAEIRLAALDTAGAESDLRAVQRRFPDSRAAALFLARIYSMRGDNRKAESVLEAALQKHPADAGLLGKLLPMLFAARRSDTAVSLAEAAHDAVPTDTTLTAILAEAYSQTGQQDRAVGLLDRASAGTIPVLDLMRAGILARQGKSADAESTLRSLLDRNPGTVRASLLLAALQMKAGEYGAARATLREGLKHTPGSPSLLDQLVGVDLKEADSPQAGLKAALATAASLRANPANLPAAYALPGDLHLAAGDARAAAAAYLAAYKIAPSGDLVIKAATASIRANSAEQGTALLEAWTATHPADIKPRLVLSSIYLENDRYAPAAQCLQAVLTVDGTNAAALNNLAWIRQRQGNAEEARILAERAYFQAPGPETADTLGWILARQNATMAALPLLKQAAASTDPSLHATAAYHYAFALEAAGERDTARTQLQSALAANTRFRERDDAERFLATLK